MGYTLTGLSLLPAGAVLLVMRSGILQRTVPVSLTTCPVTINQDMRAFLVRDRDELMPEFLAAYLSCRQTDLLRLVKWSTTVQSMNSEELKAFSPSNAKSFIGLPSAVPRSPD